MTDSSSSWAGMMRKVTLQEQAEHLAARKQELGWAPDQRFPEARKSGRARTEEKRRLLREIEEEARRQGRRP